MTDYGARFEGVSVSYGSHLALNNVTMQVASGEVVAMLGPNGAGKTTAMSLILGLQSPSQGSVTIFGKNPKYSEARQRIGAMVQVGRMPERLRVREHIYLYRSYYRTSLPIEEIIQRANLQGLEEKMFGALSEGQKRRVIFALAISGDPDLLVLDEPTAGLDVETRQVIWRQVQSLRSRGKAVLLTTHYLEEAEALADRVVVLKDGLVLRQGSVEEIVGGMAGTRIRCKTSLCVDAVRQIKGVMHVDTEGDHLYLFSNCGEESTRELLQMDPHLSRLEVSGSRLEDAFLALISGVSR